MFDIDIESLTLEEIEQLEELTGQPIDKMFEGAKARVMRALYFIIKRREDPEFTFEQTAGVTVQQVAEATVPKGTVS